jgi:hypothetical protein
MFQYVSVALTMFHTSPHWSINSLGFETTTMKLYALLAVAVALPIPRERPAVMLEKDITPKSNICQVNLLECADSHITKSCISDYKKCKDPFGPEGKFKSTTQCSIDRRKCEADANRSKKCKEGRVASVAGDEAFRQCQHSLYLCSKAETACIRAPADDPDWIQRTGTDHLDAPLQ